MSIHGSKSHRPGRAALAALVAALLLAPTVRAADQPLRVVLIDVEGGAATLFVTPQGRSLLVDAGWPAGKGGPAPVAGQPSAPSSAERIVAAAASLGVRRIDYLVVSHYHLDHVGGVPELLTLIPVGTVIDHGDNRQTPAPGQAVTPDQPASLYAGYQAAIAGHPRRIVKAGEALRLGALTLTFVAGDRAVIAAPQPATGGATPGCETMPDKDQIGGEENPRALGFVASFGKARILDLADVTWNLEKELVCPVNRLGRVDLLLVSHHGSALSSSPPLIAATAPRVALVANGARKGGDGVVLETLRDAPSAPAVWQLHFAVKSPQANRPEPYIANLEGGADAGYALTAQVFSDGAMTVANGRTGQVERYPAR